MSENVVEISVKGVMPTSNGCAVFLGNNEKTFVIYVDPGIGSAIQRAVNRTSSERPMTHDLVRNILEGFGAEVERVVINDVDQGTFYARLILAMTNELGSKIVEIDARPSDAIVLALQAEKTLYTTRKLLDEVDDMSEILAKILKENE
ncbi:MAG: bifunctional nuclease family protein [Opitutales bacterium]